MYSALHTSLLYQRWRPLCAPCHRSSPVTWLKTRVGEEMGYRPLKLLVDFGGKSGTHMDPCPVLDASVNMCHTNTWASNLGVFMRSVLPCQVAPGHLLCRETAAQLHSRMGPVAVPCTVGGLEAALCWENLDSCGALILRIGGGSRGRTLTDHKVMVYPKE